MTAEMVSRRFPFLSSSSHLVTFTRGRLLKEQNVIDKVSQFLPFNHFVLQTGTSSAKIFHGMLVVSSRETESLKGVFLSLEL